MLRARFLRGRLESRRGLQDRRRGVITASQPRLPTTASQRNYAPKFGSGGAGAGSAREGGCGVDTTGQRWHVQTWLSCNVPERH